MPRTAEHPLVAEARRLAATLAPAAEAHDRTGVTPEAVAAVKASGVLGVNAPAAYGGAEAPAQVGREIAESLAAACCSTFVVQAQHHTPVRALTTGNEAARARWLRPLSDGTTLAGVAFSHLRAHPARPVMATRVQGGWRYDGRVPWYTGWGLNDVFLLGGETEHDEVVFAMVDAVDQQGLTPTPPLQLAALTGTRTVALLLDGLFVPDEAVAYRSPYARWATEDRPKNTNTNPAVLGITRAALDLLDASADDEARHTADLLRARLDVARRDAYALVDEVPPAERLEDRLAVKTRAYDLMRAATTAALVAGGGRAFGLSHPAQRLAREGLFLVIQGQTAPARTAHLRALRA